MEISDIIQILWKRKFVIIIITAISFALALVGTRVTAKPETVALIRILTPLVSQRYDFDYADRLNNTFDYILESDEVQAELKETLDVEKLPKVSTEFIANSEIVAISAEVADPTLVNTLADILVRDPLKLYYGGKIPDSVSILSEIDAIKSELGDIFTENDTAVQDLINEARGNTGNTFSDLSTEDQRNVLQLENRISRLYDLYNQALINETRIQNGMSVVEYAEADAGSSSGKIVLLVMGLIFGLFTGIGVALVINNIDNRYHFVDEIHKNLGLQPVGYIPKSPALRTFDAKSSLQFEYFKYLLASIRSSESAIQQSTLLVTSADPQEGKSTISANLACAIAQLGKRVLLIDADMRRPAQNENFKFSLEPGLSDLLTGKAKDTEKVIHHDTKTDVWVLSAGSYPENSTRLLASPEMNKLIEDLRSSFDTIVIDSPALTVVADSLELMNYADNVLFVIRLGKSSRDHVEVAMDQFRISNIDPLLIINEAPARRQLMYYKK